MADDVSVTLRALALASLTLAALPAAASAQAIEWSGVTSDNKKVSFFVGKKGKTTYVSGFSFVSECSPDPNTGQSLVKRVKVVKKRFKYKDPSYVLSGRLTSADDAEGVARYRGPGCDSGTINWTAQRVVQPESG